MTIRCLAVDDEPLALDIIESYIGKLPYLQLVKTCSSATEAMQVLQEEQVDLIFLDIEMPELTGIQFLNILKHQPLVIFTTAYPDYALEGFNQDAVDYLLKPIPFDRFLKAVTKAQERLQRDNGKSNKQAATAAPAPAAPAHEQDFMFVKADYKTIRVDFKDILWIEGLKDYIIIQTKEQKIITLLSMNKMMEKLSDAKFLRVHRSFIVSLQKIDSIEKSRIRIGNKEIPIGEVYKEQFLKWVEENNIQ
ncbi:LytR/AlgR family response regulator transcription factor [Pontibacter akesuensis]|uniref:Two component transcriptional regulator, LytTR family n=1 Tax=Pontibacter akesuensis TaxID=388950 RepID=A0A1I7GCT4_9BACT|nr:response regulator transcription factor [Pontibacter akesuensis]GHA57524.1 DNA-binding response regulator [Pontibacter akesuensis]SFU46264.1 two component transcriptional regulator, LytTR family [Pontibacter akesuensis]